jgi:hypothetical protein
MHSIPQETYSTSSAKAVLVACSLTLDSRGACCQQGRKAARRRLLRLVLTPDRLSSQVIKRGAGFVLQKGSPCESARSWCDTGQRPVPGHSPRQLMHGRSCITLGCGLSNLPAARPCSSRINMSALHVASMQLIAPLCACFARFLPVVVDASRYLRASAVEATQSWPVNVQFDEAI